MSFDDIPEDSERSEQCRCGGSIKGRKDGRWECDTCDWISVLTYPIPDILRNQQNLITEQELERNP